MEYRNPYIKVTWADTAESFTSEKVKRVKEYFKEKYNTRHVNVITKVLTTGKNTKLKTLELSESILDPNHQKRLMEEFIKENDLKVNPTLLDRLDNTVNEILFQNEENRIKYNRWYIKNIEFSNFLSFGDNNVIDFEGSDGITVVESNPRNFGGKTTGTVDVLLFLFFNKTTKTKTNGDIFNRFTDKDEVSVKGVITIDGDDYIIHRTVTRKKSRSGDYTVRADLEFYKILQNGEVQNLAGEQRRETEQFITKAIGTEEDFLSTILTTGYNLEELIDSKPTARGFILTKFLGLDQLKKKEDICRERYNEYQRKMVSNTHDKFTLEKQIDTFREEITTKEGNISATNTKLGETTQTLTDLQNKKDKLLSEKHGDVDNDLIKTNPQTLKNEISEINEKIKKIGVTLKETVVKEPKEYYLEEDHDKLKDSIRDLNFNIKEEQLTIDRLKDQIKQLTEGSICPECKRPLENVDHTKEIKEKENKVKEVEKKIVGIGKEVEKSTKEETKLSQLKKDYDAYEKNKLINAKYELEIEQNKLELETKNKKLEYYETNKKKHERNLEIDKELIILKTKIETANSDIKQCNVLIERFKNEIKSLNEKITTNKNLIAQILKEQEVENTFKVFLTVFGKKGISKNILREMIPLLNNELSHLLDDSCYFKLEVNINENNELEFVMIDSETRVVKPIQSGSGYERTISSLALRAVLTKVSSLPKPNIVVMDEVFGKIADDNIEMVGEFFKKIKDYFEHIFVISHNPLIRTWSDNLLMIEKEDNVSKITSLSTKIS
jgi:DNA repair exonuclease SbcCD ATPase subunit